MSDVENPAVDDAESTAAVELPPLPPSPSSMTHPAAGAAAAATTAAEWSFSRTVAAERNFIDLIPAENVDVQDAPEPSSGLTKCCMRVCDKANKLCNIILYPFMILFTAISLILIVTFCVIPTICFMGLGICAYYCFMDDPIPLHLLLRYMFSPDNDADNPFASGAGGGSSSYPTRQDRSAIEKKLIVRRLVQIVDCDNEGENNLASEEMKKEAAKKQPRRHPQPIWVATENKFMKFSEPLVTEETNKAEEDEDKKKKSKTRRSNAAEGNDVNGEEDDNSIVSDYVPHYQRLSVPELSNRNLQETDVPEVAPAERSESNLAEIALGDGTTSPRMTTSEDGSDGQEFDEEIAGAEDAPITEEELIGTAEDRAEDEAIQSMLEIQICVECSSDEDDDAGGDVSTKKEKKVVETRESMAASSTPSQKLEADYFGIESDVRDRHTVCDICLLEYEVGDEVAWSPNMKCTHTYHKDCVLDWLVRKPSCPNCRHDFTKGKKSDSA